MFMKITTVFLYKRSTSTSTAQIDVSPPRIHHLVFQLVFSLTFNSDQLWDRMNEKIGRAHV